jgi:hypothetical protein
MQKKSMGDTPHYFSTAKRAKHAKRSRKFNAGDRDEKIIPVPSECALLTFKEVVTAFYPPFRGLKFRHSSSSADSCACNDALCGRGSNA